MFNQNMSVALVPRGTRCHVGRERLVILLNLSPTHYTSARAPRGSTPACRGGARLWHAANQGRKEVEQVGVVPGVGDGLYCLNTV